MSFAKALQSLSRRRIVRLLQVAVSLGLLTYLIVTVPLRDVATALGRANLVWVLGAFSLVAVTNWIAAVQMRSILRAQDMPFTVAQIAGINLITRFYNLFLPGYLAGGVIRWYHFSSPEGKRTKAFAAIIVSREVELVTLTAYGLAFWLLARAGASGNPPIVTLGGTLLVALLVVLASVSRRVHRMLHWLLERVRLPYDLNDRVRWLSGSLVTYGSGGRGHLLSTFALSLLRGGVGVIAFVWFARALGITTSTWDLGWIRSALDLVLMLPFSISGLGVREASLVAMLAPLGVRPADALALSGLLLARMLIVSLLGGVVEALRLRYGIAPGLAMTSWRDRAK